MNYPMLRWILPAALLASCENPSGQAGRQYMDSVNIQPDSLFAGFYEDSLPAAGIVRLTISKSGEARLVTDHQNFSPEVIQIGSLQPLDSNKVQLSLVTVGVGDPVKDTFILRSQDDGFVYQGTAFGGEALHLQKKEKPAPQPRDLIFWIKSESECDLGPGFGKTPCYQVQYGDRPVGPQEAWETLSEPITGFTFEKGFLYKVKVTRIPRDTMVRNRGPYEFRLTELVEKQPVGNK
ncbi:DUF4377 domain-containing protein [Chitinophaga horti]|uniref:DUF4377 domain-containing protein n=1 Tax=Chitinophaga horti TaxID=2920382 RepID=A0ABY6IZJ0_9BACT|nr:DUF4377 domain-containing protein [Chitinophaga horti]UYQ92795.1 DUF4377 domain-containing protein [Chitinophaga horti]